MEFSGGVLTVYGPNETASIFATYPSEYLTLGRSFLDQVSGRILVTFSALTVPPLFNSIFIYMCHQVVGTGMLMLCILCLDEKRNTPAPSELIPPIVAVIVLGISMSMSANCGAAINPARDLGPRLLTLSAGWGTEVFTWVSYLTYTAHMHGTKHTQLSKLATSKCVLLIKHLTDESTSYFIL